MERSTFLKATAVAMLLVACFSAFAFLAYQTASGSPVLWVAGQSSPISLFYPTDYGVYLIDEGNVSFVDPAGAFAWNRSFPGVQLAACGLDGRLYVYMGDMVLYAFDRDGALENLGPQSANRHLSAGLSGILLRSGTKVFALSPEGQELWNDTSVISDPVSDAGGNAYYLSRHAGSMTDVYLNCRPAGGGSGWSLLLDRYNADIGLLAAADGVYLTDSLDGELRSVNGSGAGQWKYYKPYLGQYQLIRDEAGLLFLLYPKGTVHVLNPGGEMIGKYTLFYDTNATARLAAMNGTVFSASREGTLSAVVVATGPDGVTVWQASVNCTGPVRLYAANGTICAATGLERNGRVTAVLYVFDAAGNLAYGCYAAEAGGWGDVQIGPGRPIYALTSAGTLYALKAP